MNKEKTIINFKELAKMYGFTTKEGRNIDKEDYITLRANDTEYEAVDWIRYNITTDTVGAIGNSDQCGIWLCDTRPDFTPEKTIQFVKDLNKVFELKKSDIFLIKELIDPEDWQEIAGINEAYEDRRYNELED